MDSYNLQKINAESINKLRSIIRGLGVLTKPNFNISSMILIDRAKVLIFEKLKIFKDFYKMQLNTKSKNENKTGTLSEILNEKKKDI